MPYLQKVTMGIIAMMPIVTGCVCTIRGATQAGDTTKLEFDVASLKPSQNTPSGIGAGGLGALPSLYHSGGSLYGRRTTLEDLVRFAYNPMPFTKIIGGPDWMRSARYDMVAKPPGRANINDLRLMLQAFLADRFKIAVHSENRMTNVFVLEVGKNGPKLQEDLGPQSSVRAAGPFSLKAKGGTMDQLAMHLTIWVLQSPVINQTGLKGSYDFTLDWTPVDLDDGPVVSGETERPGRAPGSIGYSVFDAVQKQLGLQLRTQNLPISTVIVDHAERPSEN